MDIKQCFEQSCSNEVHYVCQCSSPETYSCEFHFGKHYKLPNRTHSFDFVFLEPYEGTKDAILEFLEKENSKKDKIKQKVLLTFNQHFCSSENSLEEVINKLDSESAAISSYFEKISQAQKISKQDQDPYLKLLALQPNDAIENMKKIIPLNSSSYKSVKLFCGLSEEIERIIEQSIKEKVDTFLDKRLSHIENKLEEHDKIFKDFNIENANKTISELSDKCEKNKTAFENWKEEIQRKTQKQIVILISQLNSAVEDLNNKINEVKNTQSKSIRQQLKWEEPKTKRNETSSNPNSPTLKQNFRNCCMLNESQSSDSALSQSYQENIDACNQNTSLYRIENSNDRNNLLIYNIESQREVVKVLETPEQLDYTTCLAQLPNGEIFCFGNKQLSGITLIIAKDFKARILPPGRRCTLSSAIYFNRSVYCFGGNNGKALTLSQKFDLDRNQWFNLPPMPKADDTCHAVISKRNLLVSRFRHRNLLSYSLEIDSFSTISYQFAERVRKILISAERLYLIECGNGKVYESEIGDENVWKPIANSIISFKSPSQAYCVYSKGGIYITTSSDIRYHKFDLNQNLWLDFNKNRIMTLMRSNSCAITE